MQRKNNLLMPLKLFSQNNLKGTKRSGFAMIMAIIVIVVISSIMALSLSLTTQTSKRTVDMYLKEQAVLYSKSAAELALLDISEANFCSVLNTNYIFGIFTANVTMRYVYDNAGLCAAANDRYFVITTPEQSGSVLMDITVTINDPTVVTEPIRYFRRIIQKL